MPRRPEGVDTSVPNIARMYDYYLGGKDNFQADRVAAEEIIRLVPAARTEAMTNRQFLRLAVRYLSMDAGISQFLDIGVGLPTQGAVHEVAREVSDGARVGYVDYDPVVVSHANTLLTQPNRSVAYCATDPVVVSHAIALRTQPDRTKSVAVDKAQPNTLRARTFVRGNLEF